MSTCSQPGLKFPVLGMAPRSRETHKTKEKRENLNKSCGLKGVKQGALCSSLELLKSGALLLIGEMQSLAMDQRCAMKRLLIFAFINYQPFMIHTHIYIYRNSNDLLNCLIHTLVTIHKVLFGGFGAKKGDFCKHFLALFRRTSFSSPSVEASVYGSIDGEDLEVNW